VFNSFHGLYPGENVAGGKYIVNVKTSFAPMVNPIMEIVDTLNYEGLFQIVSQRMDTPTPLIETLAMQITSDIRAFFPGLLEIYVSIEKSNPPIPFMQGSVLVEYSWSNQDFGKG
jgi:dihydroneopterin aldolase